MCMRIRFYRTFKKCLKTKSILHKKCIVHKMRSGHLILVGVHYSGRMLLLHLPGQICHGQTIAYHRRDSTFKHFTVNKKTFKPTGKNKVMQVRLHSVFFKVNSLRHHAITLLHQSFTTIILPKRLLSPQ